RFVQRYIGVAIAGQAGLVAPGGSQCLADADADVLDRAVGVDVQITRGAYGQVDQPMAGNLFQHVIEETDTGSAFEYPLAVEIEFGVGIGVTCPSLNCCAQSLHGYLSWLHARVENADDTRIGRMKRVYSILQPECDRTVIDQRDL